MVHLSSNGWYGEWFEHTTLTHQTLGAIQRKVCPTVGAGRHLEGRLWAGLEKGRESGATVSAVGMPWVLGARLLTVHTAIGIL